MGVADEIEIVPIGELTGEILRTLIEFDADSQRINFPKDAPNRKETEARIRREFAEEPEGMQVVRHRGKVVGCLFLKTRHNPYRRCDYLDLRNIYLAADYRGKGVGRRLLAETRAFAAQTPMALIGVSHAASEHLVMETQMPEWFTSRFDVQVVPIPPSTWWR